MIHIHLLIIVILVVQEDRVLLKLAYLGKLAVSGHDSLWTHGASLVRQAIRSTIRAGAIHTIFIHLHLLERICGIFHLQAHLHRREVIFEAQRLNVLRLRVQLVQVLVDFLHSDIVLIDFGDNVVVIFPHEELILDI